MCAMAQMQNDRTKPTTAATNDTRESKATPNTNINKPQGIARPEPLHTDPQRQLGWRGTELGYVTPFSSMRRFMEHMDHMFEDFSATQGQGSFQQGSIHGSFAPQIEVFHEGEELVVRADLPGVNKENVHVEISGDLLTISGERKHEHEERREGVFHSERSYGSFSRSVRLPHGVARNGADANFHNGVLEIRVASPKSPSHKLDIGNKSPTERGGTTATTMPGAPNMSTQKH